VVIDGGSAKSFGLKIPCGLITRIFPPVALTNGPAFESSPGKSIGIFCNQYLG
jgi:hypothetical protein